MQRNNKTMALRVNYGSMPIYMCVCVFDIGLTYREVPRGKYENNAKRFGQDLSFCGIEKQR